MPIIKEYFEQAQLSAAAYAKSLDKNMSKNEFIAAPGDSEKFTGVFGSCLEL